MEKGLVGLSPGNQYVECAMKTRIKVLLPLLLLLSLPALVQAQFTFTTNNGAITITRYTGLGGNVIIPSTTNGYPVTNVGDLPFYSCSSLTSITIPKSVTDIGDFAFANCASLTRVVIPTGVTSIGLAAFDNCTSLTSVTLPDSVLTIARQDCSRESQSSHGP